MTRLEEYFSSYRKQIIGIDHRIKTPYGEHPIVYADWTASGRMYKDVEHTLLHEIAPFVANTHTETSTTGCIMTHAYDKARNIIKAHVGAGADDVIITTHSGMTGVVNKFQRILGLRIHERFEDEVSIEESQRPLVFVSHMEHHSNQTSWLETIAEVRIIPPNEEGLMDLQALERALSEISSKRLKIAAITSCSNVTGIFTPYYDVAEMMHRHGGFCFVDFACSAPYIDIDMHPATRPDAYLDAIYFSPHKFLGGPGSAGVLIFNKVLYDNKIPDAPGGGTVDWTNPWGEHKYVDAIEQREDGGTPAFLQTMKVALCCQLKDQMGTAVIRAREDEIMEIIWNAFDQIENLHVLADQHRDRLGVVSFYIDDLSYNLGVRMLNDRFGIQVRGGCSCAGTYGHYLLNVSQEMSESITCKISEGDLTDKPGWIRMSIHPTTTDDEATFMTEAIAELAANWRSWAIDYERQDISNEFEHRDGYAWEDNLVANWFSEELKPTDASYLL